MKADVEIPFEEVLEKAKAGDPKAQTEVRTSIGVGVGGESQDWRPQNTDKGENQNLGWGES